ncbi:DUF4376 domain-containing protein [Rhodoferax ferrireducens]|uniref:DUF4376 domain-containing protein n=1 Tax=Rhodoferax ferrireducens TaxID=192843 RepID=UPI001E53978B|nr:DUF4376 domain-containing protein [Rhodoferax ferrireducens]
MKLLVNAPFGRQELIEVGEGGGYFDPARVLWDERVDGPLPETTMGGMVRVGGALVLDAAILAASVAIVRDAAKADKWEAIKAERDRRTQTGGYYVAPHWYHSDTFSRTQQLGLVMLGVNIPSGTLWKTLDNGLIAMTQTLAGQIFGAAAASDIAIFAAAQTHKAAMEASADPTAYDFSGGWPVMYEAAP